MKRPYPSLLPLLWLNLVVASTRASIHVSKATSCISRNAHSYRSLCMVTTSPPLPPKGSSSSASQSRDALHRLERILSNRGAGSRSESAKLIKQGKVTVDGKVVKSGSTRFRSSCLIHIDDVELAPTAVLAMYHKPVGVLTAMSDSVSLHKNHLDFFILNRIYLCLRA